MGQAGSERLVTALKEGVGLRDGFIYSMTFDIAALVQG